MLILIESQLTNPNSSRSVGRNTLQLGGPIPVLSQFPDDVSCTENNGGHMHPVAANIQLLCINMDKKRKHPCSSVTNRFYLVNIQTGSIQRFLPPPPLKNNNNNNL